MANAFGFVLAEVPVARSVSRPLSFNSFAVPQKPQQLPHAGSPFPGQSAIRYPKDAKFHAPLIAKASGFTPSAIQCRHCKGSGVNATDLFDGRFKAGQLCWLCRGKREVLCGNCNGAGFVGGFMSTFDE